MADISTAGPREVLATSLVLATALATALDDSGQTSTSLSKSGGEGDK